MKETLGTLVGPKTGTIEEAIIHRIPGPTSPISQGTGSTERVSGAWSHKEATTRTESATPYLFHYHPDHYWCLGIFAISAQSHRLINPSQAAGRETRLVRCNLRHLVGPLIFLLRNMLFKLDSSSNGRALWMRMISREVSCEAFPRARELSR